MLKYWPIPSTACLLFLFLTEEVSIPNPCQCAVYSPCMLFTSGILGGVNWAAVEISPHYKTTTQKSVFPTSDLCISKYIKCTFKCPNCRGTVYTQIYATRCYKFKCWLNEWQICECMSSPQCWCVCAAIVMDICVWCLTKSLIYECRLHAVEWDPKGRLLITQLSKLLQGLPGLNKPVFIHLSCFTVSL